jgi:PAS domain S-box-containing protein
MNATRGTAIPPHTQEDQLRDQVAELEGDLARVRQSLADAEQEKTSSPQPASDNYYKEVFDHLSVCMFFVDVTPEGRFRYVRFNPAEEAALGLTTEQVAGKFVEEVFAPDLTQKLVRNYRRCVEEGRAITYDDELNLPTGSRHFHSNLIPLRNNSGRIHRIVGACIDTTDLKRTQEEALSRQKFESLGVLAAGIAHDFNNLLGSILAQAELAETELAAGASPRQEIRAIQSVASHAGKIVRELMTYAGQESTIREPTDLSLLVQEMLELLKISVSKHAVLQVDLPKNLPAVQANPVQLRQVIMNLITNASEALGDKGGVISISLNAVTGQDSTADRLLTSARAGFLRLTIADTGAGMTPDILSRIFDPFYTTKLTGRGLGLSAVQGIIRSHNGTIIVSSTPGQGSQFEILLPCTTQPLTDTSDRTSTRTDVDFDGPAGTILMIEDEEVLRQAVATMLRKRGFRVIEAGDGATGMELFRNHGETVDAVLLDMTLPTMGGAEVFGAIRQVRPNAKVILTSAYSHNSVGGEQAPWAYIRKPYLTSELSELLRRACQASTR